MEVLIWILVLPLNSHYDSRKTTCVWASDFSSVKDGVTCFNKPSHLHRFIFTYLKSRLTERKGEKDFSSSGILSRWLQQPKVSQEEVGNQELHPGARPEGWGPKEFNHFLPFFAGAWAGNWIKSIVAGIHNQHPCGMLADTGFTYYMLQC